MRRRLQWVTAASVAGVAAAAALLMPRIEQARERERWGMLETYCSECHNADDRAGDLTFDALTPASVPEHAEIFEAAVRKLRGRLMPPPGNPQPEQREIVGLVGSPSARSTAARRSTMAGTCQSSGSTEPNTPTS